jgi:hypothetical protein
LSNTLLLDSDQRLAIVDTHHQEELNKPTTSVPMLLSQCQEIVASAGAERLKRSRSQEGFNRPTNFITIPIRSTKSQEMCKKTNHLISISQGPKDKADPLQELAKRSVASILQDTCDEERESGDVEIVLCSSQREDSIELDADYNNEDGDLQSINLGRGCASTAAWDDYSISTYQQEDPSIVYFRQSS